eukprot:SAG31_NODE_208_length_20313_cov_6.143119_3_plen_125_part_00
MIALEVEQYGKPVRYSSAEGSMSGMRIEAETEAWTDEDATRLRQLIFSDPLEELSKSDRELLWRLRFLCKTKPEALPKVLLSADWTDPVCVREAHRYDCCGPNTGASHRNHVDTQLLGPALLDV